MITLAFMVMLGVTVLMAVLYTLFWFGSVVDDSHRTRFWVAVLRDVVLMFLALSVITLLKLYPLL